MEKTTVYLDAAAYRELKQIARRTGRKPATLVREAVAEYAARHRTPRRLPAFVGAFDSGLRDLGTNDEKYLKGFGEDA
jgi:predicted transcriptional regulator